MAIITVPKALREKLGEDGSDALVEMINHSQDKQKADVIELVGEKFERRLSEEISGVNNRISGVEQRIEQLRSEFKEDHANLRAELKTDIANSRTEIIKWMFIFWVGQVVTMIGILFAFFR